MKKLMIACAAIAMAIAAQAAAIDWSVANNSWTLKSGDKAAAGTTVYLVDANYADTLVKSIAADGSFNASQAGVYGQSVTANGKGSVAELPASSDSLVAGKPYDFAILVIDTVSETGKAFAMVSGKYNQTAYDASALPPAPTSVAFGADQFSSPTTSWTQTGAAPEPTSGMLLLLGVAGLALKRKRA